MNALSVRALRRSFGDVAALDGISFDVRRGELFGVVGPDGAGKTTLLRILAGVLPPTSGDADVLGVSVAREPERAKPHIAYMSQRFGVYADLTVRENILFYADLYRVPKRELVTILQVALQAKRLRIAEGLPLAELLVKELRGFRVRITATGHAKFGNDVGEWREADHDDLVLATALAVWRVESRPQVRMAFVGSGRRPGLPGFRRLG